MIEEIKQLKELLDIGAITQEEYDRKKTELLNGPNASLSITQTTGQPQHANTAANEKSKIAAGLLAIFLGSLGVHKFYLGYTTAGIVMLLITLFGSLLFFLGPLVMGIISLIEGIIYLTKSDDTFDLIYVQNKKEWF